VRSLRRSPAKHIELLPQDQVFRFQRCSCLEARSQDTENQLQQIGHQDASLRRPLAASTRIEFSVYTGIKFNEIGVIFITHPHSDHIAGLGPLMAIERHDGRKDPINVYGPHGVETIVAGIIQYFTPDSEIRWDEGLRTSMQDMFRGHEVAPGLVYQDANIKVTAAENTHFHLTPANPAYGKYKSYSYRFETPDKVVVFR
jgi:ribonuclease BN (tRNA processing enzyme)